MQVPSEPGAIQIILHIIFLGRALANIAQPEIGVVTNVGSTLKSTFYDKLAALFP